MDCCYVRLTDFHAERNQDLHRSSSGKVNVMPLVTIKYQKSFYTDAFRLMNTLPTMISENSVVLGMGDNLPEEAVQVEMIAFEEGLNIPHVWLKIQFTESVDGLRASPEDVVHQLFEWMRYVLVENGLLPNIAIDLFFGPGHGMLDFAKNGDRMIINW